jgi:hypothetical protein
MTGCDCEGWKKYIRIWKRHSDPDSSEDEPTLFPTGMKIKFCPWCGKKLPINKLEKRKGLWS